MKPPESGDRKITYKRDIKPMRDTLHQRFPKAFSPRGSRNKKPLAIGIDEQVRERTADLDELVVRWAMFDYVGGFSYLESMRAGAMRVDLDGNPVGIVTEADQTYADNRIRNKRRREASRKKA